DADLGACSGGLAGCRRACQRDRRAEVTAVFIIVSRYIRSSPPSAPSPRLRRAVGGNERMVLEGLKGTRSMPRLSLAPRTRASRRSLKCHARQLPPALRPETPLGRGRPQA